jgi:hypothetical protein
MEKAAFNNKMALFAGKVNWDLRKKLVKCYSRSVALYGAGTGTVRADQKQLESLKCGVGEGWRR